MGIWCGGWPLPLLTDKCQTEIGARVQENQKKKNVLNWFRYMKKKKIWTIRGGRAITAATAGHAL